MISEDPVKPDLLFVGTELGLWISIDGGEELGASTRAATSRPSRCATWRSSRATHDLVIGHARPRHLDRRRHHAAARADAEDARRSEAAFLPTRRPVQQRIARSAAGSRATPASPDRTRRDGAVITYYQKARHLFGKLKIEVLDDRRASSSTRFPASKRRGINRVAWSMRVKPPRVPPAAHDRVQRDAGPARRRPAPTPCA